MFAIVKYSDNYMEICTNREIKRRNGDECIVKYKGCNYQGQIVATSGMYMVAILSFLERSSYSF